MVKRIAIVGGGISGLAVLHHLKKKYVHDRTVEIRLFEKSEYPGGTVKTIMEDHFIFEAGPNGFLANSPHTLELINDLGLEPSVIKAKREARARYISFQNQLYKLPCDPMSFLTFTPLSFFDKIRLLLEIFVPKRGADGDESIYDFGTRRFGENFTKVFLDAMVTGIYGGDIRTLSIKSSLPKIYNMEKQFGSLFHAVTAMIFEKIMAKKESIPSIRNGQFTSLQKGMGELIFVLHRRYADSICVNAEVNRITMESDGFVVEGLQGKYQSNEVFVCTPAYHASEILQDLSRPLSLYLRQIEYVPIAVVGLAYRRASSPHLPKGFGYLVPSSQGSEILGVVFASDVFDGRADGEHVLFQVMIGGSRNLEITKKSKEELVNLAKAEIRAVLKPHEDAVREFFILWPKAIPQYHCGYSALIKKIENELSHLRGLFLVANYFKGVSLNDCILNAQLAAEKSNL